MLNEKEYKIFDNLVGLGDEVTPLEAALMGLERRCAGKRGVCMNKVRWALLEVFGEFKEMGF